jgi:nitroreductase
LDDRIKAPNRSADIAVSQDDVLAVMTERHCKRAFLDRDVPHDILERVLSAAAHAPSSRNTQFWHAEVLSGEARHRLGQRLCATFDAGVPKAPDYVNRPAAMSERQSERARRAGRELYAAKDIDRDDDAARQVHDRDNLRFYGAPVAMIIHVPGNAVAGTFLDVGMFLQNVMLGLVSFGLGSCPQYSVAGYGFVIREELALPDDRVVVCGLSVGYPDPEAPVNDFYPARAPLQEYTAWHD